ncbi:hypothetical protein ACFX11_014743 [Malus domestica]
MLLRARSFLVPFAVLTRAGKEQFSVAFYARADKERFAVAFYACADKELWLSPFRLVRTRSVGSCNLGSC